MARKTKPAIQKTDQQLSYWKNFSIFDAADEICLINFASDIPKEIPVSIDYLIDALHQFPEQAFYDQNIWGLIALVRESEIGGGLPRGTFDKILKAMRIECRGHSKRMKSGEIKQKIQENLAFFLNILDRGDLKIDAAITQYIDRKEGGSGELKGEENYRRIYNAYITVYKKLTALLSHKEAIHFLGIAGSNVDQMGYYSIWTPDKRPLLYVKGAHMLGRLNKG